MIKGLNKVFEAIVNKLNNESPNLRESGSAVSHSSPEPRHFSPVTRLPAHVKKATLKATLKYI